MLWELRDGTLAIAIPNIQSLISNLLGHYANLRDCTLVIWILNFQYLRGWCAKRLHIGDLNPKSFSFTTNCRSRVIRNLLGECVLAYGDWFRFVLKDYILGLGLGVELKEHVLLIICLTPGGMLKIKLHADGARGIAHFWISMRVDGSLYRHYCY